MPISTQVTVTDTPSIIAAAANSYQNIYLHNLGGGAIYIGGPNVTINNGYKLDNGDTLSLIIGDLEALYGVTAAGTHTVSVLAQK
jgi:hypothetical protein